KAAELGVDQRTVRRWVKAYEENGEAGLVLARFALQNRIDPRWSEAALAIMREHTDESKPSEKAVIYQTSKRLEICFGHGVVPEPSQATAYRELKRLEAQHRTFTGTTARNRDIATRPKRPLWKTAANPTGRVRDPRYHPAGCIRHRPNYAAVDSNRTDRGHGLVHPLHRRAA